LSAEIQKVREIILGTHEDIVETIKWHSPTFIYKRNMASYFMNAKNHVSLMSHKGAFISDETGLLKETEKKQEHQNLQIWTKKKRPANDRERVD